MEDVHHLRVFLAVAESLSFTRAAEHLFLTQSAVSHQIARLEREIGASLFDRRGKSISVTPSGHALVPHARRIFAAMDEASIAVRQTVRPDLGRLRIGASPSACQYIIPEALREFRESFPNYSLSIVPADSPAVIQQLLDESIDLGLAIRPDRQKRLHFHNLFIDELGFVVSPLHPWAKTAKVDRRELRDQRMVLYSRNSATFRVVDRYLTKMGALRDWIELGETGASKNPDQAGFGNKHDGPSGSSAAEVAEKDPDPFLPISQHWQTQTHMVRSFPRRQRPLRCRTNLHRLMRIRRQPIGEPDGVRMFRRNANAQRQVDSPFRGDSRYQTLSLRFKSRRSLCSSSSYQRSILDVAPASEAQSRSRFSCNSQLRTAKLRVRPDIPD